MNRFAQVNVLLTTASLVRDLAHRTIGLLYPYIIQGSPIPTPPPLLKTMLHVCTYRHVTKKL